VHDAFGRSIDDVTSTGSLVFATDDTIVELSDPN